MSEHPILFSCPMIRAILEGKKTQTRRVIKLADGSLPDNDSLPACFDDGYRPPYIMDFSRTFPQWKQLDCPYGLPGDSLWVRETWQAMNQDRQWWHEVKREDRPLHNWAWTNPVYPAYESLPPKWLPSIHMPRAACRITLKIIDVRVERLWEMTVNKMLAEGVAEGTEDDGKHPLTPFITLWQSINGKRAGCAWQDNPWVWVVEFTPAA